MAGQNPDYDLCVSEKYEKNGEPRRTAHRVGVAWKGEKGQINIHIGVPLLVSPTTDLVLFDKNERVLEED